MNVLFWNLNKKPLLEEIGKLVANHNIDILALAECQYTDYEVITHLNSETNLFFYSPSIACEKIKLFTKFSSKYSKPKGDQNRWTIREIKSPIYQDFLLVIVHLPSKVNWSASSQAIECGILVQEIEKIEQARNNRRTIILGDFNMDPFEAGMVSSGNFHATMDIDVARKIKRTVQSRDYFYFFNPMWGFYGNLGKGNASGSHYYSSSEHLNYHWHIYDQVLIRPELIDEFNFDELEIITENEGSLYLEKITTSSKYSDHLPIKFSLNLNLK